MAEAVQFESIESLIEKDNNKALLTKWLAEIDLYESDEDFKEWDRACERVKKAYKEKPGKNKKSKYSILWANLETMKPAVFYQMPKVEVGRRYKDRDPIARTAAEIIERSTQYSIDSYNLYGQLEACRDDFLKYARCVAWTKYNAEYEKVQVKSIVIPSPYGGFTDEGGAPVDSSLVQIDEMGTPFILTTEDKIVHEEVSTEFLHKKNFGHTLAKNWSEVKAVWKIAYMTRDELVKRFGEDLGKRIPLDYMPKKVEEKSEELQSIFKKAKIYEIWDKEAKRIVWLSKSYQDNVLDVKDDILGLKNFFPCVVLYGSTDGDTLAPIPDFCQWEGLNDELNEIVYRKSALTKAIKATGFYDSVMKEDISKISSQSAEMALFPVEQWAAYVNKGGVKGAIDWMPIQDIAVVLKYMYEVEANLRQQLFEISGQSDLMRGATDPRETATAQRLKGSYGNLRLSAKQKCFSEFIRDIIEIKAEIIAEIFADETILNMALVEQSETLSQTFPQALEMLRSEPIRNYRIDIETDSTLAADDAATQEQAVQFVNVITQGLNDTIPILQGVPQLAPMLTETMLFLARRFRAGRSLEASIEQSMEAVKTTLQQAQGQQQGQQVDPRVVQSQNEQEARMAQAQLENDWRQKQLALEAEKMQSKNAIEIAKLQQEKRETEARVRLEAMEQGYDMGLGI